MSNTVPAMLSSSASSSSSSTGSRSRRRTSSSSGTAASAIPRIRIFVVGLGMVGIAFIEKILNNDTEGRYQIVTCGEEKHLAYNRVGLTEYFLHRNVSELYLNSPEWYKSQDPARL